MTLIFGSLFAEIGGLDLGLERAGMQCKWQVEIDEYATKVLEKHWPDVARFRDVRDCGAHNLKRVDLICGGFPCQDISDAGAKAGLAGKRSGLWFEFYRIISELRPRYAVVENVAAITKRGLGTVLGNLAEIGYNAEWESLPASAFSAPHFRDRVFIMAYADSERLPRREIRANAAIPLLALESGPWATQPPSARVAYGVSKRLDEITRDRLRCLGNAVVPQVAQWIGERIIEVHKANQ